MSEFFEDAEPVPDRTDIVLPPMVKLVVGAVVVLIALLVALPVGAIGDPLPRFATGWLVASIGPPILAAFQRRDVDRFRAETDLTVSVPTWLAPATVALATSGLLVSALHSWRLATELAS